MTHKIKSFFLICFLINLVGCSTFINDYKSLYPESIPNIESMSKSSGKQIYNNTVFYKSDFKSDGNLKSFNDYNYAYESSPCTALGDKYLIKGIEDKQYYEVSVKEKKYQFVCQFNNSKYTRDERRLYLVGTFEECKSRTFDYNVSIVDKNLNKLGKQCNSGKIFKTSYNLKIENDYNKSF